MAICYFKTNDDDVRVAVDYDSSAENPVAYTGIGLYLLEVNRNYRVSNYDDKYNAEIDEALENSNEEWSSLYEPSVKQRQEFAEAWLTERNIPFYTYTVQVYRDWVLTGIFYATEDGVTVEQIRKSMPLLNAWYNGDVYCAYLQKQATYVNADDADDVMYKWIMFGEFDFWSDIYDIDDVPGIVKDNSDFEVVGGTIWDGGK